MNNNLTSQAKKSLKKIQEIQNINQKIAFYSESASDWNHYSRIINELINIHKIDVYYITSDHTDQILNSKNISSFYIGYDKYRTIFFQTLQFKVFVSTGL